MSALLESLAAGFDGDATRRALLDEVLRDGLPARAEAWKYTSLRALERRHFGAAQAVAVDPALLADIPAPRLVFVNGRLDATLSDLSGLPVGATQRAVATLMPSYPASTAYSSARREIITSNCNTPTAPRI